MKILEGFKVWRHNSNPKEKELHDKFIKSNSYNGDPNGEMSTIVFGMSEGMGHYPKERLSDREEKIVISTIQWLGSPVGQNFLRDCGFEKVNK